MLNLFISAHLTPCAQVIAGVSLKNNVYQPSHRPQRSIPNDWMSLERGDDRKDGARIYPAACGSNSVYWQSEL